MSGRSRLLGKLFSKKHQNKDERATEIGMPTNVKQHIHVSKNSETGQLEGLPNSWLRLLNAQITPAEQHEHPDAAIQALKFHIYTYKKEKAPEEPFKPLVTEAVINEEDLEIDRLLDKKNAHQSQDSDLSYGQSSEEDASQNDLSHQRETLPVTPTKHQKKKEQTLDLTTTVDNLTLIGDEQEESPILRKKEISNVTLTDEEIYEELRRICNKDDPYVRFQKVKQVGSGASGKFQTQSKLSKDLKNFLSTC